MKLTYVAMKLRALAQDPRFDRPSEHFDKRDFAFERARQTLRAMHFLPGSTLHFFSDGPVVVAPFYGQQTLCCDREASP
ncbi:MAG: hypothetical protein ACREML_02485 [Vulcanimicrobiaceae bacterium]